MLLNEIGLMYSGSARFLDAAQREHGHFAEAIRTWNLLPPVDSSAVSWSQWAVSESKNRLAYAIWVCSRQRPRHHQSLTRFELIDCMATYHHEQKPFLCLEDMHGRLPCKEELWDATSEEDWTISCAKSEGEQVARITPAQDSILTPSQQTHPSTKRCTGST